MAKKIDPNVPFAPLGPLVAFFSKPEDKLDAESKKEIPPPEAPFQPTMYLKARLKRAKRNKRKQKKNEIFRPQEPIETFRANAFDDASTNDNPFLDVAN